MFGQCVSVPGRIGDSGKVVHAHRHTTEIRITHARCAAIRWQWSIYRVCGFVSTTDATTVIVHILCELVKPHH